MNTYEPIKITLVPDKELSHIEKLARDFRLGIIIAFVLSIGMWAIGLGYDDSDNTNSNIPSGLSVFTDYKTGCQYLGRYGTLTPRLNGLGKQEGCK